MKKLADLKKLDTKKLNEELLESRKSLFKVKFEVKSGQSKNSHLIGNYKKQIARIKTLLNEKDLVKEVKEEIVSK